MKGHSLVPLFDPTRWKEQAASVSYREWWAVFGASVGVALLAFLPYLFGYLTTPEDSYYLGFVLNAKDQNTYFMWMTQVASGEIFLKNLYTSIPHDGALLNLYFILFALPARLFGWSLDVCYQLARVCSSLALGLSSYAFVALFFHRGVRRWTAWATVLFSAGFGWFTKLLDFMSGNYGGPFSAEALLREPIDMWVPEAYPWFALLIMPHFAMALALFLLTLRWITLGILSDNIRKTASAGCCLFILSFVHPYDVIVLYAIIFGVAVALSASDRVLQWQRWRHVLVAYTIATTPIVYNYLILNHNPGMRAWLVQNISISPPPLSYVLGFGIPLVFGVMWLSTFLHRADRLHPPWLFVAAWMVLAPLLLYAPIAFQRRLAVGMSVPLAVAMVAFLYEWVERRPWSARLRASLIRGLIITACLTSVFHGLNSFRKVADRTGENYISLAHVEALERVRTADGSGTVLSSVTTGNMVPRFSGRAAVIGSRGQTGDFGSVLNSVQAFYAGEMTEDERARFLNQHRVEFIYYGSDERQLDREETLEGLLRGSGWEEWTTTGNGEVKVFRRSLFSEKNNAKRPVQVH